MRLTFDRPRPVSLWFPWTVPVRWSSTYPGSVEVQTRQGTGCLSWASHPQNGGNTPIYCNVTFVLFKITNNNKYNSGRRNFNRRERYYTQYPMPPLGIVVFPTEEIQPYLPVFRVFFLCWESEKFNVCHVSIFPDFPCVSVATHNSTIIATHAHPSPEITKAKITWPQCVKSKMKTVFRFEDE